MPIIFFCSREARAKKNKYLFLCADIDQKDKKQFSYPWGKKFL
jgi:hypothetical protein